MERFIGAAIPGLALLASCAPNPAPDPVLPAAPPGAAQAVLECSFQSNASPAAIRRCRVLRVTPDTPEARRRAEAFVASLPGAGSRDPFASGLGTARIAVILPPD